MMLDRRRLLTLAAAGAAPGGARAATLAPGRLAFDHGVGSGDPLHDRVILWTRVTPVDRPARVEVAWELAEDAGFRRVVKKGFVQTGPERDYTVKVDVAGLAPGRVYRYRFRAGAAVSPAGRTRTLSQGRTAKVVVAVSNCALYPAGLFNGYRHMAEGPPLDAVINLGDYIYEYGGAPTDYGAATAAERGRLPQPMHEVVSLADYRTRHALYKADPDLQAAHACAPWICTWDDHDVANDDWTGGAQNHQPETEGPWPARKAAALQAYYEWMPIREPAPGKAREAIYRAFEFGDLVTLAMLETRLTARSQQLSTKDPELAKKLADPSRRLMAPDQHAWLNGVFKRSVERKRPWQLLGNQVILAPVTWPDLARTLGPDKIAALPERSRAGAERIVSIFSGEPRANMDSWDGYPADRERLYAGLRAAGANLVVVSGDSHSFWVNRLGGRRRPVGVEFGVTSISSPSLADDVPDVDLAGMIRAENRDVLFHDQSHRGYLRLTLTRTAAVGELISTGVARPFPARAVARYRVTRGAKVERLA